MLPPPDGVWGMPPEMLETLPGYGPDVEKNRDEARAIMQKLGYGPDKPLNVKVATRNIAQYRDPAVILIDQLKHIYIDGELEPVETANWFPKVARKDYQIGLNLTGSAVDDPDQQFYENYACGSQRNYSAYCNKEIDELIDQQSAETGPEEAQEDGLGDRPQTAGGRRPADHHPQPRRDLLAALGQERDLDDQQHLQRLAHGRLVDG